MEPTNDKRISEHVLRMHRYRNPGEEDGAGGWSMPCEGDLLVVNRLACTVVECATVCVCVVCAYMCVW